MTVRARLTFFYAIPVVIFGGVMTTVPLMGASRSSPVGSGPAEIPMKTTVSFQTGLWLGTMAVLVVLAIGGGWILAGSYLRPLRSIIATARDISANNLHRRLGPAKTRDEFEELSHTLDDLFERLETAFTAQRHFVANASHELRTPLTAERTVLQVALADPDADVESLRAACQEVLALSAAQQQLIDALLALASGAQAVSRNDTVDLADVARDALESHDTGTLDVAAELDPAPVTGDRRLIRSLVANLVDNAARHNTPGGRISVATAGSAITVGNTGPVVPPSEVDRLFEPFQQLDGRRIRHGKGYGLGLAIVRAVAEAHGAKLTAVAPAAPAAVPPPC